jgi:MEDS: MEthanogen/methylotroph, DcmR Sensory domain
MGFSGSRTLHAVQFYTTPDISSAHAAEFIAQGLFSGQPGLVIAAKESLAGIGAHLARRLRADARGPAPAVTFLDAHEVLASVMSGDSPDPGALLETISRAAAWTAHAGAGPCIYADLADVLWKNANPDASLDVELFWERLAQSRRFSLLCGYWAGNFDRHGDLLEHVCRHHTHVLPRQRAA